MNAVRTPQSGPRRNGDLARWALCFAVALAFHAAGAAALFARWNEEPDSIASAPLIMVDLAPLAVAPQTAPNEVPPGPQQVESEPEKTAPPVEQKVELPPQQQVAERAELPPPQPQVAVTPPPEPKPPEPRKDTKPKRKQHASLTSAPSPADSKAERAAAPAPGAGARNSNALPSWKSELMARLERAKRYPAEAQSRGEHGVAQLAFSVDRSGGVHHAHIVKSSGSSLLDRETLALVQRAQPLPPPPADLPGAQITVTVPIRYNIR